MRPQTGLLLRLVGMLIELLCVVALVSTRGQGRTVAGVPVGYPLFAGLVVGLVMDMAGINLVRRARPGRGVRGED